MLPLAWYVPNPSITWASLELMEKLGYGLPYLAAHVILAYALFLTFNFMMAKVPVAPDAAQLVLYLIGAVVLAAPIIVHLLTFFLILLGLPAGLRNIVQWVRTLPEQRQQKQELRAQIQQELDKKLERDYQDVLEMIK